MGISLPGGARNLGVYAERTAEVNKNFEIIGMAEFTKKLDALMTTDPEMEKKIQRIIGQALKKMKGIVGDKAGNIMEHDPRHAEKAVRYTVYRRILGGNISILQRKKRGAPSGYTPTRTLKSGQRGGNRRIRSERTTRMEGYEGEDRGFILRFLETGVRKSGGRRQERGFRNDPHREQVKRGSQGGDISKYGKTTNTGSRGSISSRNWFGQAADMGLAAIKIEAAIDKLIQQEFNKG